MWKRVQIQPLHIRSQRGEILGLLRRFRIAEVIAIVFFLLAKHDTDFMPEYMFEQGLYFLWSVRAQSSSRKLADVVSPACNRYLVRNSMLLFLYCPSCNRQDGRL